MTESIQPIGDQLNLEKRTRNVTARKTTIKH